MTRDTLASNRIAILATGDEITVGDIVNTNSPTIAQKLFKNGMHAGLQMVAPDNISEIQKAIEFLLRDHKALVMTGGLGPTSDDITRYALSNAVNHPLVFDESTWQAICDRFQSLGYKDSPPEGNKQQALFPETATIIPNSHGTAAGCLVEMGDKLIFMLPGPPNECLPMFDDVVLKTLKKHGFQDTFYYEHWLLFGVSEGHIAEKLDEIAKSFDCVTGYRLFYPYIEFKLYSNHQKDFQSLLPLVEETVSPFLLGDGKVPASEILKNKLAKLSFVLNIRDSATGGLLEFTLQTPETHTHLNFFPENSAEVEIIGLDEYWSNQYGSHSHLEIKFRDQKSTKYPIPFRGSRVKLYAVEFICNKIDDYLQTSSPIE